jgi:HSP20 family protein
MNLVRYESMPTVRDIFDDFFRGFFVQPVPRGALPDEFAPARQARVRVEVAEENGAYKVRADLPGVKKEDIQVTVDGDVLSIQAETRQEKETKDGERVVYSERQIGKFARSFRLASEIELDKAEAKYADGVLELTLPKKTAAVKQLTVH